MVAILGGIGAAFCFGASTLCSSRSSRLLGSSSVVAWVMLVGLVVVLPPRAAGVLLVAVPLALGSRLQLTRRALPLIVASGLAEVAGFAAYAVGARHGIAISAVLASQFAAVAAVGAYLLFGERLGRVQLVGVAMIVAGVAALSGLTA